MKMTKSILYITFITGVMFFIVSCDGMFDGIYDTGDSADDVTYGFKDRDAMRSSGTIYINASSFRQWMYIDFHARTVDSAEITDDFKDPEHWDIAVHHYDVRTNGGTVMETASADISTVAGMTHLDDSIFVGDVWTDKTVIVDISQMMSGKIGYEGSYYNTVLSRWMNVDKSQMPPTYTLSERVYVIRMKDGTYGAVHLSNYMNVAGVKGYLTIDYVYPINP